VRWMRDLAIRRQSEDDAGSDASAPDYTLGVYQSIGYREFCGYLEDPTDDDYKKAIERMKISTRQYAKRQISWIRNKLIPALNAVNTKENIAPLYLLDATLLADRWQSNVHAPATKLLDAFLGGEDLPEPKLLSETASRMLSVISKPVDPAAVLEARRMRVCHVCTSDPERPIMIEEGPQWDFHQSTRSHRRAAKKLAPNS